jgi:hypothetical protein
MGAAPLWLCFLAQGMSVIGDSFGQRTARVYHHSSRRHFITALAVVSCLQMFVGLTIVQLARPEFTKQIWTNNATDSKAPQYDFCKVNPQDEHCYHQGPLTIYRAVGDCPLLFTDELINIFYYLGEAALYSQPLGLLLLVMASLSSAFIISPLQTWLHIGTTGSIPVAVIIMGIAGALMCVVERNPKHGQEDYDEIAGSHDNDNHGGPHASDDPPSMEQVHIGMTRSSLVHQINKAVHEDEQHHYPWYVKLFRLMPLIVPFTLLSLTYALYFLVMKYFNDTCKLNAWGYNAFDQVALPPFVFGMFFLVDAFQWTRTKFESDEDQKETYLEAIKATYVEMTSNKCAGFWHCFAYRGLVNARAMIYTYLAIQYDLNQVYLQLTLIRVALSWVGSVVLVLVIPKFIQTSNKERAIILDKVNLALKVMGTVCIVTALILLQ